MIWSSDFQIFSKMKKILEYRIFRTCNSTIYRLHEEGISIVVVSNKAVTLRF